MVEKRKHKKKKRKTRKAKHRRKKKTRRRKRRGGDRVMFTSLINKIELKKTWYLVVQPS